jgi:predicted NBD/HSP70 family sugar kinase
MAVLVGLDIGGTKIMVAAADCDGNIPRRERRATSTTLGTDLTNINNMIAEVAGEDEIRGMGAATGGPLDWEQGIVSPLHQPDWRNVPLKALMEKKWGCPFQVDAARNLMEEHLKLVPAPQVGLSQLGYDTALPGAIAMALNVEKHP